MRKITKSKNGSTLVEVIVSFFIVLISVIGFQKVVTASIDMLNKSSQLEQSMEDYEREFYKKNSTKVNNIQLDGKVKLVVENGSSDIDLKVDKWKIEKREYTASGDSGTKISSYSIVKITGEENASTE